MKSEQLKLYTHFIAVGNTKAAEQILKAYPEFKQPRKTFKKQKK